MIDQQTDRFSSNTLLRALSNEDYAMLRPRMTRVMLEKQMILVNRDEPIEHIFFLEGGIASIISEMSSNRRTEIGIFGREGMSATCVLLGSDRTPHETFMQVDGATALRIDTQAFLDVTQQSETLRTMLLRYVQTVLVQGGQSTATNAYQRMEARLARWLLMCHDRIDGDEIAITHEFIGMMIAAERSGVTVGLHILEGAGMIQSKRGRVIVRDRAKLLALAGDSYGVPEAEYRRLIGPIGR